MKREGKVELKGMFKGIVLTLFIIGIFTAGAVYATTIISDTGITIDDNTVLVEGDYTTWTLLWENPLDGGIVNHEKIGVGIDDVHNNVLYISWLDNDNAKVRFAIKNIIDCSNVFTSSSALHYCGGHPEVGYSKTLIHGIAPLYFGGNSLSLSSYILLLRTDDKTIEVWRGGSSVLWSRDTELDGMYTGGYCYNGIISSTGKYIVLVGYSEATSNLALFCYEGS